MDYEISVVPPGGGEQDYGITIRGAAFIPRPGEYIVVRGVEMDAEGVVSAFKVRYAVTYANREGALEGEAASAEIVVEAEPIFHPYQTTSHRQQVEAYANSGLKVEEFPESGY